MIKNNTGISYFCSSDGLTFVYGQGSLNSQNPFSVILSDGKKNRAPEKYITTYCIVKLLSHTMFLYFTSFTVRCFAHIRKYIIKEVWEIL